MTKITIAIAMYINILLTAGILAAYTGQDLYNAANAGELDKVNSVLAAGVNPDTYRDFAGYTALHEASWYNHIAVVKALVVAGANINSQDKRGSTPISYASWWGYTKVVSLLAGAGADVDMPDRGSHTPIMKATWYNHASTVQALIKAHANIEIADEGGDTALHWAARYNLPEITQILLFAGAPTRKLNTAGQTPGDAARSEGNNNLGDMIDYFTGVITTTTLANTTTDQPCYSTPSGMQIAGIICVVSLFLIIICIFMKYCFVCTRAHALRRAQARDLGCSQTGAQVHAHPPIEPPVLPNAQPPVQPPAQPTAEPHDQLCDEDFFTIADTVPLVHL